MNTKKVQIEIPADMEVKSIGEVWTSPSSGKKSIAILLVEQQPRRWIFEEIVGKREVYSGDLCFDPSTDHMYVAFSFHKLLSNWIAVRKVEDVNT